MKIGGKEVLDIAFAKADDEFSFACGVPRDVVILAAVRVLSTCDPADSVEAIESVLAECDRTRRPLPTNVPSKTEWARLAKSLIATVKKEE